MEGEIELETEQEQVNNFFRLTRLLLDVGNEVLRDLLLSEIKQDDLEKVVQQNVGLVLNLKHKRILTEQQYNLLLQKPPDPTEFDISLLLIFLRNLCRNIKASGPNWKIQIPKQDDLSIGADLLRIRNIKNATLHMTSCKMPKSTFAPLWTDLKDIILRIASEVGPESIAKAYRNIQNLEKAESVIYKRSSEDYHTLTGNAGITEIMQKVQRELESTKQDIQNLTAQKILPPEILRMDRQSIEVYKKALEEGSEKDYSIRLMVVGPHGVGKTALTKRLLEQDFDINQRDSTDGIDIHVRSFRISLKTSKWITEPISTAAPDFTQRRILKVLKSTRTDLNGSSGLDIGEKGFADESRTHDGSSKEKSELPETPIDKQEREHFKANVKEDDESLGSAQAEEDDIHFRHIEEVIAEAGRPVSDDDYASVSVWDFGGQFVFYTTHQMFLTHRAIYILVINMSQRIGDIMDDKPYFDCSEEKSQKLGEFLDMWLYSVCGQSKTDISGTPPIILVGTHTDKLDPETREKEIDVVFDAIRHRFAESKVRLHFIEKDFGLSNAERDPKLEDLKQTIIELAEQQSYWGEIKPAKWIQLEKAFSDQRSKGVQVISRRELEKMNQELPVPVTSDEELDLFLCFQHKTGNIMYFSVPELKDQIVLNPQFLVNALKCFITAEEFCKKKPGINWWELREKGLLTEKLLDAVWDRKENQQFQTNREHILALMKHLHIIAGPLEYAKDGKSSEDVPTQGCIYLAPCMIKQKHSFPTESEFISTPRLYLKLKNVTFPGAIFTRLLAGCISHWKIAKSGNEYQIKCGYGQFDMGENQDHRLTISFSGNLISLSIQKYATTDEQPDVSICQKAYSTVKQILERIGEIISIKMKLKDYLQCPHGQTTEGPCKHSIQKLITINEFPCHGHKHVKMVVSRDLLKYWFDPKEMDPVYLETPAKIMERKRELECFCKIFRLVVVLIDVGTGVLRDLLLSEIKQDDLEKVFQQNASLLTRLKGKKVLTETQYNILQKKPPDPTEFDISLLVALVRNLCRNIEAPDPKWNIQCPKQDDLSIGADLLRIKNTRNIIMHLATTRMENSTFTGLWKDLNDALLRIAGKVSPESTAKATREIRKIEKADINPSGGKESKTLETFHEWHSQCNDISRRSKSTSYKNTSSADGGQP